MKRREFLALAALSTLAASWQARSQNLSDSQRSLVIVQLVGANDGLNTFIPYTDPNYTRLRPNLAIKDGIPISNQVALHPALANLKPFFDREQLTIVQNVSYPNPDLSHFRSQDIWESAKVTGSLDSGWLARYLQARQGKYTDAIFLGEEYPLALLGENDQRFLHLVSNLSIPTTGRLAEAVKSMYHIPRTNPLAEAVRQSVLESQDALVQMQARVRTQANNDAYPRDNIGNQFAFASVILEGLPPIVYLTVGGWDTHLNQLPRQQMLLQSVGNSLAALMNDLITRGTDRNVLIMVQTEFGRRPAQNGSGGTDHGTATPVFFLGSSLKGGILGGQPDLANLVNNNLPWQIDFRSLYSETIDRWFGGNARAVLGSAFPTVGFLA